MTDAPTANKAKGDAFRDRVRDLCIAAGYKPNVEVYIRGKKADVVYDIFSQPRSKKVAIECKSLRENLPKSFISEIIGDYTPGLERRELDEVWIVAEHDFTTEARNALEERPGFYGLTYLQFLRTLINFPQYLQYLKLQIENDGILDFYVSQRFKSHGSAISYVDNWLRSTTTAPLAVLSTYGMGKTSLAKVLAHRLIQSAISDPHARIPILIPLGALAYQQQIEGLLGTIFTSDITTTGYNFPLFQKMNSLGHFVILLDGLDEMRHAMTWADFQYNFSQISKIITPRTKAIMFGRPNTFRNKEEYERIIEGATIVSQTKVQTAGALRFQPVEIEQFTIDEIYSYLANYIRFLLRKSDLQTDPIKITNRVEQVKSLRLDELIARPVHAQMVAQIASDFNATLTSFTRSQLYDKFIDFVLYRDFERSGGVGLQPIDRRHILRRLAWHVWFEIGANAFQASEIRIADFDLPASSRIDAREREILSGTLIEAKPGDHFYFSHRSFQEFLIAETILAGERRVSRTEIGIKNITDEIVGFIIGTDDSEALYRVFENLAIDITDYGPDVIRIAFAIYKSLLYKGHFQSEIGTFALQNICLGMRYLELWPSSQSHQKDLQDLMGQMRVNVRRSKELRDFLLTLLLGFTALEIMQNNEQNNEHRMYFAKSIILTTLASLPLEEYLHQIRGSGGNIVTIPKEHGFPAEILRTAITLRRVDGKPCVGIDFAKVNEAIAASRDRVRLVKNKLDEKFSFEVSEFIPPDNRIGLASSDNREVDLVRNIIVASGGNVRFVELVTPRGRPYA